MEDDPINHPIVIYIRKLFYPAMVRASGRKFIITDEVGFTTRPAKDALGVSVTDCPSPRPVIWPQPEISD
jgi:hypothetical protein